MASAHIAPFLEKRIQELNKKIDSKILRGKSYKTEAREHRALLARMKGMQRKSSVSTFGRSLAFLHFLF